MTTVEIRELFARIANQIQSEKKIGNIDPDVKVSSLGLDSLVVMEVVGEIQDELNISIPAEHLSRVTTIKELETLIQNAL